MERADSALGPLIKDLGLEDALRLYRVKKSWKETLGEPLAIHTSPTSLKGGLLHINADTPAWLQQVGYYRAKVIEKLAKFGVSDIRAKLGRVERDIYPRRAPEETDRTETDPALIEEILSSIEDKELREAVRSAARKALGSQKKKRI